MNNHKKGKWIIGITFITVVGITIYSAIDQTKTDLERVVQQEDIYCLSAICLNEGKLNNCLELNPVLSHVIVTDEPNNQGANRIIIKPTDNSCGRNQVITKQSIDNSTSEIQN